MIFGWKKGENKEIVKKRPFLHNQIAATPFFLSDKHRPFVMWNLSD